MRILISQAAWIARHIALCLIILNLSAGPARAGMEEGRTALESGDYLKAEGEFRTLAEQGDPEAQLNLGLMYEMGWGLPLNLDSAASWYRKAAEQGYHFAQDSLGSLLNRAGQSAEALQWFLKAAEQGNASAQNNLGFMYSKGQGVPADPVQAYKWYLIAAETEPGGYGVKAKRNLRIIEKTMRAAQKAEADDLAREWLAKHNKR